MHSKAFTDENDKIEEVVIKIDDVNLKKSLYYRDEGNMNVVVSLIAREHDEKRVIRFKKVPASDTTKLNHNDHKNELMTFINFEKLLQKYFENADQFTVVPRIVFLDANVQTLNDLLMPDRPIGRRSKIIGNNYGLLYRDVAFLPKEIFQGKLINGELKDSSTFCIEIKPKQGFIMARQGNEEFTDKKCRFCFFQYLKLKNGRIKSISRYCPLNLFSGHPEKMNAAIKNLIENPQNNLKMFKDGKMIFNERSGDAESFNRVLENIFPGSLNSEKQRNLFVNLIRKILLKDFKDCDKIVDISSSFENDKNIHDQSCVFDAKDQLPSNSILKSILGAQLLVKNNFERMKILDEFEESMFDETDRQVLQSYRIGSTALDCSVMITFRKIIDVEWEKYIDRNHTVTIKKAPTASQLFATNATIVDLDLKKDSLAHFHKYRKQCQDSKQAYSEFLSRRIEPDDCSNVGSS